MKKLGKSVRKFTHFELMMAWFALALLCFSIRAVMFGALLSPSLRVLFGMPGDEFLGPVSEHKVALEDPLLLVATVVALLVAARYYCLSRSHEL